MKLKLPTTFATASLFTLLLPNNPLHQTTAFTPSSINRKVNRRSSGSIKYITNSPTTLLHSSKKKNDDFMSLEGIVEVNAPKVYPTNKKKIIPGSSSGTGKSNSKAPDNTSSTIISSSRKPRFQHPPDRESGYYESRVHKLPDGHRLVFDEYYVAENEHDLVVCLNNLADVKLNEKSTEVFEYCRKENKNFLCFDWFGRGESTGKLMEATISRWTEDTIHFLENEATHVKGGIAGVKAALVGVGVGGWVAVLVALRRPDLVRGIVGLSADPDFTEDLLWNQLPEEEKDAIMRDGFREVKWGGREEVYPITSSLIIDGRKNLVLRGGKDSLEIMCPVRLIHSLEDEEVPYSVPLRLADAIQTNNIRVIMPKVGGHDLQEDYTPAGPGWIDPEDKGTASYRQEKTIKSTLEDCLDQVFFSTMEIDASDTW